MSEQVENLKLKPKFRVLEQAIDGRSWNILEEFGDKEQQLEFLTKESKTAGFVERALKLETVYAWE